MGALLLASATISLAFGYHAMRATLEPDRYGDVGTLLFALAFVGHAAITAAYGVVMLT